MTPISSRTMCRIIRARQIATAASAARNFSSNRKENSNLQLKVLYEDNHLLVISKPSNIACESGSLFKSKTKSPRACIQSLAEEYLQTKYNKLGKAYIGLVHRLDRWTTGVMVLAKTSKASQRLSQQFREKTIEKKYICVVSGHVQTAGECRHMLSNTREKNAITRGNINFSQAILDTRAHVHDYTTENITHNSIINPSNPSPNSQSEGYYEAHLTYRPLGSWTWPTGESIDEYKSHSENAIKSDKIQIMSLLEVTPSSGRKHQIRAQLSHIGWPIVGDTLYSSNFRATSDQRTTTSCLRHIATPVPRMSPLTTNVDHKYVVGNNNTEASVSERCSDVVAGDTSTYINKKSASSNNNSMNLNVNMNMNMNRTSTTTTKFEASHGIALHASSLYLTHPVTKQRMHFYDSPPSVWCQWFGEHYSTFDCLRGMNGSDVNWEIIKDCNDNS